MGREQYLSNSSDRETEIERLVIASFQRVSERRLRPQSLSGHLVIAETVLTESAESVFTKFIGRVNNIQIELCNSEL